MKFDTAIDFGYFGYFGVDFSGIIRFISDSTLLIWMNR